MSERIAWSDSAPLIPTARIWTPPIGLSAVCVLGNWRGVWIHWMGKRSLPCLDAECPKQRHLKPAKWVGYLPACTPLFAPDSVSKVIGQLPIILPLTAEQAEFLKPAMGAFPGPHLTLERLKEKKEWAIRDIKPLKRVAGLPACPNPEQTLYRAWGVRPPEPPTGSAAAEPPDAY